MSRKFKTTSGRRPSPYRRSRCDAWPGVVSDRPVATGVP
jgi:hypothetical protein